MKNFLRKVPLHIRIGEILTFANSCMSLGRTSENAIAAFLSLRFGLLFLFYTTYGIHFRKLKTPAIQQWSCDQKWPPATLYSEKQN